MPTYIIKIRDDKFDTDYYMEWSTVVDAPVTYGMSLEDFNAYYKDKHGTEGMKILEDRLIRVEAKGTSAHPPFDDLESLFRYNRAGSKETTLSKEEILQFYCRQHSA